MLRSWIHLFTLQHKRILIKGGTVVNHDRMFDADVFIEDGVIKYVVVTTFWFDIPVV